LVLAVLMVMAVAMGECKWAVLCVAVSDKRADHRARRLIVTTVRVVAPPPLMSTRADAKALET